DASRFAQPAARSEARRRIAERAGAGATLPNARGSQGLADYGAQRRDADRTSVFGLGGKGRRPRFRPAVSECGSSLMWIEDISPQRHKGRTKFTKKAKENGSLKTLFRLLCVLRANFPPAKRGPSLW